MTDCRFVSLLADIPMLPTHQLLRLCIIPNAPPLVILPVFFPDLDFWIGMPNHIKHTGLPFLLITSPYALMGHSTFPSRFI